MVSGYKKPNAAVGQSGLQALYETMFRNYGIIVAQVNMISFYTSLLFHLYKNIISLLKHYYENIFLY